MVRQAYLRYSLPVGSFLGFTVYPFETVPHHQEGDCIITMEVQRKWRPQQDLGDDCTGRHGIRLWNVRRVCCLLGQSAPWQAVTPLGDRGILSGDEQNQNARTGSIFNGNFRGHEAQKTSG